MLLSKELWSKLSLLILVCAFAKPGYTTDWKQYIPATGQSIKADIMEIQPSAEFAKLAAKFQAALQKNPEWTAEYMGSAPKGQPLPYHENLGLTKQEFNQMNDLTQNGKAISLAKTGTIDIEFKALPDGNVKIVTTDKSPINNIVISSSKASTDKGDLTTIKEIKNKDPNATTGPWEGIKWGADTTDPETMSGQVVQFCIGKLDNKQQGIIYYDGKILKGPSKPLEKFTHIIFFPLPQKG